MRKKRVIRLRGKRKQREPIDIDITSLLDILVIMLVFLLKSYNSSGVVLNVPKGLLLPESQSQELNSTGVIIQVSPSAIWVDDKEIINLEKTGQDFNDQGSRLIAPLYNELIRKKQMIQNIEKQAPNAQKFTGIVNLLIDKSLKYNFVKKLLYTSAEAGFRQYKFVVLGEGD